ncbi:MAG: membrane dipeptidase [Blautia sp.]|nr:membrane dipeptidase [Blautia sp.]
MGYIDLHCDTLMQGYARGIRDIYDMEGTDINIRKLRQAGCEAQFFAVFFPARDKVREMVSRNRLGEGIAPEKRERVIREILDGEPGGEDLRIEGGQQEDLAYFEGMREILLKTADEHSQDLTFVMDGESFRQASRQGKTSAFLTLEDGRAVQGRYEMLDYFYKKGVRLITLTWNYENCFGYPNSRDPEKMALGLKPFGREAVKRMNELGILVDTSHLSDGGFYDVAAISDKPFIASHSNARALSPHPRNLTDDMLRIIGEKHGVAGLNFYGAFLSDDGTGKASVVSDMVRHALYIVGKAGEDALAIGSDFDGFEGECQIRTPLEMPLLFESLKKAGLTERQIEKAIHLNARRVIESVI